MELLLVRHALPQGIEGRAVGHEDLPLAAAGAAQAWALAASWRGPAPDRIFTSDLRRAAETARILGRRLGLAPTVDARLRELCFGEWEGQRWDDVHRHDADRLAAWGERWWEVPTPGGESFADLSRRVLEWFRETREAHPDGVGVAVAHSGSIRALLGALLDWHRQQIFELRLDHARVSAVERGRELAFVNRERFPDP